MTHVSLGILIVLMAGVINGSFAAPTKYTTHWKWENIWGIWAVIALFATPWFLAFLTVPDLLGFYRNTSAGFILLLVGFGFGVGLSQVLFGLGLAAVGLSTGFAVTIGLSTALGSFVPLVLLHTGEVVTPKGVAIITGVAFILIGTGFCGLASKKRDRELVKGAAGGLRDRPAAKGFGSGLLLCIIAGVLAPLLNIALALGAPLLARADRLGVSPSSQANVIWPPLLTAAMVPYLAYCFYLWRKNVSFHLFTLTGTITYWFFGIAMGILWFGSLALYGTASVRMASMGPILGWPLFMSTVIITSNAWGFATGEWKSANREAVGTVVGGIFFLIVGFCAVAAASMLG